MEKLSSIHLNIPIFINKIESFKTGQELSRKWKFTPLSQSCDKILRYNIRYLSDWLIKTRFEASGINFSSPWDNTLLSKFCNTGKIHFPRLPCLSVEVQDDRCHISKTKENFSVEHNNPLLSLNFNIEYNDIPVNFRRFPLDFRARFNNLFGYFSTALRHKSYIQANK